MKYFGTDGIRGLVGEEEFLSPAFVKAVAFAVATTLDELARPVVIVGRDTRESGKSLESIFTSVLNNNGVRVVSAGVVPTAVLSFLTKPHGASLGIMLTASHNPPKYNGIKIFDAGGEKLDEESIARLEEYIDKALDRLPC